MQSVRSRTWYLTSPAQTHAAIRDPSNHTQRALMHIDAFRAIHVASDCPQRSPSQAALGMLMPVTVTAIRYRPLPCSSPPRGCLALLSVTDRYRPLLTLSRKRSLILFSANLTRGRLALLFSPTRVRVRDISAIHIHRPYQALIKFLIIET